MASKVEKPENETARQEAEVLSRLFDFGPSALSDAELIGLILRHRTVRRTKQQVIYDRENPPLSLARELLTSCGDSLTELGSLSLTDLRLFRDMGQDKAVVIAAAMELGKRRKTEESLAMEYIHSKDDLVALFKPRLAELPMKNFGRST